jgi:hypothetical protein
MCWLLPEGVDWMAEESCPATQGQPGDLPRRIRGANHAQIPTQVLRGYLPVSYRRNDDRSQGSFEDAPSLLSWAPPATVPPNSDSAAQPASAPRSTEMAPAPTTTGSTPSVRGI